MLFELAMLLSEPVDVSETYFRLSPNVKTFSLLLGIASFSGGVLSLFALKRNLDEVYSTPHTPREIGFETRKYRRRAIASSLIASQGIMLGGIYAVDEMRTMAIFVSIILLMLVGIMGIAMFDFFSVGLNEIARTDDKAREAMVKEYARQRQLIADQKKDSETEDPE
jgi:hypothetical protein